MPNNVPLWRKKTPACKPLGRPRVFSESPLNILVYPERNIRPIDRETVEQYKSDFLRGDAFPPIDVAIEQGRIVVRHGYHRTIAAQEVMRENPEKLAHLQLELREFRGNESDSIFLMLNSQNSLDVDPVSRAEAYRSLINQGLTPAKIGAGVNKSGEHVNQQLLLVEAEEKRSSS
ncbi:hypothetical protein VQ574_20675 (plasmid) [Stutzerimonas frequens]|uniref:hypothetical protein n=1 Tax=Stutzerimonas frequens TaxID=2968969 RepID=UPI002DB70AD8|nr:hypothetical protein [Stutzerimonas frequens]WRW29354.1 hypothetical protein VQ574_20675 [Stutzerimonas frequens]